MDQAILTAVDTIRAVLPEGAGLSLGVFPTHIGITLHTCAAWLREQGATVGPWYGFDDDNRCQRNLVITVGEMEITGCESNFEAGITIAEALLENSASTASLAA